MKGGKAGRDRKSGDGGKGRGKGKKGGPKGPAKRPADAPPKKGARKNTEYGGMSTRPEE